MWWGGMHIHIQLHNIYIYIYIYIYMYIYTHTHMHTHTLIYFNIIFIIFFHKFIIISHFRKSYLKLRSVNKHIILPLQYLNNDGILLSTPPPLHPPPLHPPPFTPPPPGCSSSSVREPLSTPTISRRDLIAYTPEKYSDTMAPPRSKTRAGAPVNPPVANSRKGSALPTLYGLLLQLSYTSTSYLCVLFK